MPLGHFPPKASRNKMGLRELKNRLSRKDTSTEKTSLPTHVASKQNRHEPAQRQSASSAQRQAPQNGPSRSSDEAPPAYSPAPNAAPLPAASATPVSSQGADDPYAFLTSFDTVVLIDDSGSMAGSRWRETALALQTITPICTAHDSDGIDIYFLNTPSSSYHQNVTSSATVREIFQTVRPGGGTPTGQRLNQIIKPYLRKYEREGDACKPMNIICITDGEPSDDVESPLIAAAKKLDKLDAPAWQLGVQFFQVGGDEEAKRHLQQLDDELAEIAGDDELRDIVDTVPFTGAGGAQLTGDGILKVVLGAVNRRLDRKKSKDLHR